MNSNVLGLRVAGTIFGIVSIGHFVRVLGRVEIVVGGMIIPQWPSVIGCLVTTLLCVWLWKLSRSPMR